MTTHEHGSEQNAPTPEDLEPYLQEREQWLDEAVVVAAVPAEDGQGIETDPLKVFAKPSQARSDAPAITWTPEKEAALREIARRYDIGGETDVPSGAEHEVLEGGKPWKVQAEAAIASGVLYFAGAPHVELGEDELTYMAERLRGTDETPAFTQYDMVAQVAALQEGFVPLEEPEIQSYGYDLDNDFALVEAATGQVVKLGTLNGQDVYHLRVDMKKVKGEDGKEKTIQPRGPVLARIVDQILTAKGDETSSVGFVTSNTYAAKRLQLINEGLGRGRPYRLGMYGRQTLADIQGKPVAEPPAANQLPGEFNQIADSIKRLRAKMAKLSSS